MMTAMKITETAFDLTYLTVIFTLGILMFRQTKAGTTFRLFSFMALTLGTGDCFHLIPRIVDYWIKDAKTAMSIGGAVTAITMTYFYVMLWNIGCQYYHITKEQKEKGDIIIWIMTVLRMILIMCPQNNWGGDGSPYIWEVLRNIPFCIIGIVVIIFYYKNEKGRTNSPFQYMWLAVTLSFAFYAPVFLLGDFVKGIGVLMVPKTIMYVWITWMGYKAIQLEAKG